MSRAPPREVQDLVALIEERRLVLLGILFAASHPGWAQYTAQDLLRGTDSIAWKVSTCFPSQLSTSQLPYFSGRALMKTWSFPGSKSFRSL